MERNYRNFFSLLMLAGIVIAPSAKAHDGIHVNAQDSSRNLTETHHGEALPLGAGKVTTYVVLSKAKDVTSGKKAMLEMGVEIPAAVMNSLPAQDAVVVMDLPAQAKSTPFSYVMLDWNAHGHEPAGVYDKPHFDFHFYIQELTDVMSIEPGSCFGLNCDAYQRAMKPLPVQYMPQGYMNVGSVVPYMGNHLINPASPEFLGTPFTRTLLYGVYDGQITFVEPMITKASIVSGGDQCTAIPQPQRFAESGYYATKYCTKYDANAAVYRISLQNFVYHSVE